MKDIPPREQPISERYRLASRKFCAADAAATLLEEMKTTRLEQLKTRLIASSGDTSMADNKAERLVKSSPDWETYLTGMCHARAAAQVAQHELVAIKMEFNEWQAQDANARAEYKLGRMGP